MNTLTLALERSSLIGMAALVVAWLAQKLLENRVPATWRVWIWRVALLQAALALSPFSPLTLMVLPSYPTPVQAPPKQARVASSKAYSGPVVTDDVNQATSPKVPSSELALASPAGNGETEDMSAAAPSDSTRFDVLKLWCYWNQDKIWLALQGLYALGLGFHLVKLAWSSRNLRRALRSAVRIEDDGRLREVARRMNVKFLPRLIQVEASAPFLIGIIRPCIVLSNISERPRSEYEAILSHELAHLKRCDIVWNILAWGVQTALWFHPLTWVSRYFLPLETESACDEMVLASSRITPNFYGTLLLNTMSMERTPLAAGVADGFSSLKTRLVRLNQAPRHPRRAGKILFASALGLAIVLVLPIRLVSRSQAAPEQALAPLPQIEDSAKKKALIASVAVVQGTVLSPDGKPVQGARISWVSYNGDKTDGPESILAKTQSDAQGHFRFADSKALLEKSLSFVGPTQQVQSPQLLVEADGWGCTARSITNIDSAARALQLTRPTELQATFLDPQGQPLANLPVRLSFVFFEKFDGQPSHLKYIHFGHLKYFNSATDANGVFRMGGLPQGGRARLAIDDERFAELAYPGSEVELTTAAQTSAKPVHLVPGATLRGRVTNSEGKPVAGIRVAVQGQEPTNGWGESVSDKEGNYRIAMLGAGRYNLALDLDANKNTQWTAPAHEGVSVAAGSQQDNLDFTLEHGVLITGRVVTQGTGEPVEGAMIGIYGPAHPQSSAWVQGFTSRSDGRYQLRVPAGEQYIYVSGAPEGFVRPASQPMSEVDATGKHSTPYTFTARDGQNETIDWQLKALPAPRDVQVRVLDANGQPAKGALVEFGASGDENEDSASSPQTQTTDAAGRTVIKNVRGSIQIRAKLDLSATPQASTALGGQSVTLNLSPATLGKLNGHVVDEAGAPLAGIKVNLLRWKQRSGRTIDSVTSDAQGNYNFTQLWPDGTYSLLVTASGYGQGQIQQFQLKPGETYALKELVLPKATSFVAGRVVDATEKPMADATVWISGQKTGGVQATTDERGNFRVESIVPHDQLMLTANLDKSYGTASAQAGTSGTVIVVKKR